MKSVHFFRNFVAFTGGHLKVRHYFDHTLSSKKYSPRIYFHADSLWDESNPWQAIAPELRVTRGECTQADILFLAGLDWRNLSSEERDRPDRPIVNLIQHVRHADQGSELYSYLKRGAIRICVSQEVTDAILSTGQVRGPVFTIPNGIELGEFPKPKTPQARSIGLLILATKNRWLGRSLRLRLTRPDRNIRLITQPVPRQELLRLMADSKRALLLPDEREGFFLPALEAMALGATVIVPDCVGNRSFCHDQKNCFMPEFETDAFTRAVKAAEAMTADQAQQMVTCAVETAARHDLVRERQAYLELLDNCEELARSYS